MRYRIVVSAAYSLLLAAFGCGSTINVGGAGSSSGGTATSTDVAGKVKDLAFVAQDGFVFFEQNGTVDVILSNRAGVCSAMEAGTVRAGEMMVQLFGVVPRVVDPAVPLEAGASPPFEAKVSTVATNCAPGSLTASRTDPATTTVTFSRVDATGASGRLSMGFDDNSGITGAFTLSACGATVTEHVVCK